MLLPPAVIALIVRSRTVIRDGRARRISFVKRLFGFPELRDWLLAARFAAVSGFGERGGPLVAADKRMIIVADLL